MEDNELLLFDRLEVIKATLKGKENSCYISFSGGKDSCVLSYLIDLALPNNKIPRVFINTGIEYVSIVKFVRDKASYDSRFVIINSSVNIKKMLETKGYPFKSKEHSLKVGAYQKGSRTKSILKYKQGGEFGCPKSLLYQYDTSFGLKLSSECCNELKKKPIHKWQRLNHKTIAILGLRQSEGGQRANHKGCVVFDKDHNIIKFKPLNPVPSEWEGWFIKKYQIKLCELYYDPYNFKRTGCKGCPYTLDLKEQLETMERLLPNERKQCELIWQKVYSEYRRIDYRLSSVEQLSLFKKEQ